MAFIVENNFSKKIFGIFHIYYYLCSAVPVRPSPRLFDAGDDPGFFISIYLPHPQTFSNKSLLLSEEKRIFAKKGSPANACGYA